MSTNKFALLLFTLYIWSSFNLYAQRIQWASHVAFQYGQYGNSNEFSGHQVTGEPDAYPFGALNPKAFRLAKEGATAAIRVEYTTPQQIQQVAIIESNHPGAVKQVFLYDSYGKKYPVYDKAPQKVEDKYRAWSIIFPRTSYKVSRIELVINTTGNPGWYQVDAVGVADSPEPYKLGSIVLGKTIQKAISLNTFASEKTSLGEAVNSKFTEVSPVISPDGNVLYFARQSHPLNSGRKIDAQDIWFSKRNKDGNWSIALNIASPLNDHNPNGVCSVSPDGNTLLLLNVYQRDGSIREGVSISHRQKGRGWTYPEPLQISDHYNKSGYANYYMANDNKTLLMAVERADGQGDQDIFVSFLQADNSWSKPLNLGSTINTGKADFAPFLAADGKTLYFASEGHKGFGGSDIFYSKRLDNSWKKWSKPENMGSQINTSGWDGYYTVSAAGDYAYLVSDESSTGNSRDLYQIALPNTLKPEPVILVYGNVYNAKTKEPLDAKILFEQLPDGKETGTARANPEDGSYKIVLPNGSDYGLLAQAAGFISVNENLEIADIKEYKEVKQDLYLVPIEVGQVIKLNNIFFERSKYHILGASFPELNRLVTLMQNNPTVEIELSGHTDNNGSYNINMKLSESRVIAVKNYLVSNGVKPKRITYKAYGGTKPIASNDQEETRKLNRRVEFTITHQ
jgi:outer membrane protein OmpA-like peptidoglycan-associated protein